MSAYLNKESLLIKLSPFGIHSLASLNRLIREQDLPTKYISPRKVFFDENEVDTWLSRRYEGVVKANTLKAKTAKQQRQTRRENAILSSVETPSVASPPVASISTFTAQGA
jgi:hypothetical protein